MDPIIAKWKLELLKKGQGQEEEYHNKFPAPYGNPAGLPEPK